MFPGGAPGAKRLGKRTALYLHRCLEFRDWAGLTQLCHLKVKNHTVREVLSLAKDDTIGG